MESNKAVNGEEPEAGTDDRMRANRGAAEGQAPGSQPEPEQPARVVVPACVLKNECDMCGECY
jgi:hypothetical protein